MNCVFGALCTGTRILRVSFSYHVRNNLIDQLHAAKVYMECMTSDPVALLHHVKYIAVAITSRKHVQSTSVWQKVLCSMATEGKSVSRSNSRSLRNIRWIYPAR